MYLCSPGFSLSKRDVYKRQIQHHCFSVYVTHRSKFYEEFNIKDVLKAEMMSSPSLFGEVPREYQAKKTFIAENQLQLVQTIITEGQHIDQYKAKIKTTREFIDIMATYGGRQCHSLCLQDLKVYFREIFISKVSYKMARWPRGTKI